MLENEYETIAWKSNKTVMGIDEAGRGPLCGPLVVACCVFPKNYSNDEINDSKKLTDKKRRKLFNIIVKDALFYGIEIVPPKTIDKLNILEATRSAMLKLSRKYDADYVITDAVKIDNDKNIPIIKGDAKSISIAGASILAKVVRDSIMDGYNVLYPEYEFNKHKGYPTKRHMELIHKLGVFDIYRFSYKPCQKCKFRILG